MTHILIAVMALATVVLGALACIKLRRAAGVTPEQDKLSTRRSSRLPRELQELQIEQPKENMPDHPEEPNRKASGQQDTLDRSPSQQARTM